MGPDHIALLHRGAAREACGLVGGLRPRRWRGGLFPRRGDGMVWRKLRPWDRTTQLRLRNWWRKLCYDRCWPRFSLRRYDGSALPPPADGKPTGKTTCLPDQRVGRKTLW